MTTDAMFEATPLFWLVLGFFVGCAACWLVGEWLRYRGTIEFRDDAEQRIRDLDTLPDDWKLPK